MNQALLPYSEEDSRNFSSNEAMMGILMEKAEMTVYPD
jgi:hypothetical protein